MRRSGSSPRGLRPLLGAAGLVALAAGGAGATEPAAPLGSTLLMSRSDETRDRGPLERRREAPASPAVPAAGSPVPAAAALPPPVAVAPRAEEAPSSAVAAPAPRFERVPAKPEPVVPAASSAIAAALGSAAGADPARSRADVPAEPAVVETAPAKAASAKPAPVKAAAAEAAVSEPVVAADPVARAPADPAEAEPLGSEMHAGEAPTQKGEADEGSTHGSEAREASATDGEAHEDESQKPAAHEDEPHEAEAQEAEAHESEAHEASAGESAAHESEAHEDGAHDEAGADNHPAKVAATRSPMPFDVVRSIQFLQDQVARGNGRAIRVQALLLRRFAPVFLHADPAVWADNRNKRAAILLVLSGGPPELLSDLLSAGRFDGPYQTLAEGARAYVGGDLDTARERLSAVDLDALEPGLAAHASLVLGQLEQKKDPEAAVRNLDRARLLAPGGLVEEAALRLEMLLVADLGRFAEADRLARQYFDRYSRSSYAENFEARFAALYAGRAKDSPASIADAMDDASARLPEARRQALFLGVARRALVDGNLALADLAASRVLSFGDLPDHDRERAKLYAAAATLGAAGVKPEMAAAVAAIRRDALRPEDAAILDAARGVLVAIDRVPQADASLQAAAPADGLPVFDRADRLLRDVANDLGNAPE